MEQTTHHLTELSGLVAAIRVQGRTVRLVVRNVDRLGLLHLYFARGHLVHVEGHAGTPVMALRDLATWFHGAIRLDATAAPAAAGMDVDALDGALDLALRELEMRGVIYPAPPALPGTPFRMPNPSGPSRGTHGLPPLGAPDPYAPPGNATVGPSRSLPTGLPSFMPSPPPPSAPPGPWPGGAPAADDQALTDPQWNLLALAVRQITEHIGQAVGGRMADTLLLQALERAAARDTFLAGLEMDESGWLRARQGDFTTRFPRHVAAEAIANLLTTYEASCATLLGAPHVQEIFAVALTPLRASLAQIGLTFSAP
jgi:hypothetical protein